MFDRITRLWTRTKPRAQKSLPYWDGPFVAMDPAHQPVWTPRHYEALAREGYGTNPIAYRCVRMISEAAASLPLLLYQGATELESHPLLDLLRRPSGQNDTASLFETWYGHLILSGNAYMEAVRVGGQIVSLHVLRPDRMRAVTDQRGWPTAYIYKVGTREKRYCQTSEDGPAILHLALFNPTNDLYGMSPLEAAAVPIDVHNASACWSKALLDNAARPSGALIYKGESGAHLSDTQIQRLKSDLADSFSGSANAGRPLLLEGGLEWKPLSFSAQDMDFLNAKHSAARDIALAFGVPPMLLGIPGDNTYANYKEANLAFWRQTVLPLAQRTARALAVWLAPRWEEDLRIEYDLDQVPALTVEREALWKRLAAADFLTQEEKREAVGYSSSDGPEVKSQKRGLRTI